MGRVVRRFWDWLWNSRQGKITLILAWLVGTIWWGSVNDSGLMGYLGPAIGLPFVFLILGTFVAMCSFPGDAFAKWLSSDVLKGKLQIERRSHQVLYFSASFAGFAACVCMLWLVYEHV